MAAPARLRMGAMALIRAVPIRAAMILAALTPLAACAQPSAPVPPDLPPIDHIRVEKARRSMTLFARGQAVHVIEGIQLGDAPEGHKQFEGDERTPEGRYAIDFRNPESAYHLSLRISYPRPEDSARAQALGRSPGGNIFIHGQPNWLPEGRLRGDWTDGCIALANAEIEALWDAVTDDATVEILP